MRTISAQEITDTVARLCIEANTRLPQDVQAALDKARQEEPWPLAKSTLDLLWSNLSAAKEENLPICQDTGMACVFVELGTDVHIDGSFEAAIHEGVRRGYTDGYLRKSIVADPLRRGNTGDNTPAAITVHLVDGEGCRITGLQTLRVDDLRAGRRFDDAVAMGTFYLDGHKPDDDKRTYILPKDELEVPPYQIPYGCLVARDGRNLFMAGRCFSADQLALSSARVSTTCSMMGQAAGIAAALCAAKGCAPAELDPALVRKTVEDRGGDLRV